LQLFRRHPPLRIDRKQVSNVARKHDEVVAPLLVCGEDAADVGRPANSGNSLDSGQIRTGQRLNFADATHDIDPIGVRSGAKPIHPSAHPLKQAEEQKGDHDRQKGKHRPGSSAPQICPDQWKEFHGDTPVVAISRPLSRFNWRVARSAAFGSCVTITIVLPCT